MYITYLVIRGALLKGKQVSLVHIGSIGALLGQNIRTVSTFLVCKGVTCTECNLFKLLHIYN